MTEDQEKIVNEFLNTVFNATCKHIELYYKDRETTEPFIPTLFVLAMNGDKFEAVNVPQVIDIMSGNNYRAEMPAFIKKIHEGCKTKGYTPFAYLLTLEQWITMIETDTAEAAKELEKNWRELPAPSKSPDRREALVSMVFTKTKNLNKSRYFNSTSGTFMWVNDEDNDKVRELSAVAGFFANMFPQD